MNFVVKCPKCEFSSKRAFNVIRHMSSAHDASQNEIDEFKNLVVANRAAEKHGNGAWKCEKCGAVVPTKKGLETHMSRNHQKKKIIDPSTISLMPASEATSPTLKSPPPKKIQLEKAGTSVLTRITTVQNKKEEIEGNLACPEENCSACFPSREKLALHFSQSHQFGSELETYNFETETEYQNWMNAAQQETCTNWKIRSSYDKGGLVVTYRVCRHEGSHVSTAKQHLMGPSRKMTGSKLCPAYLKTEKNVSTGAINVQGYYEHYGHSKTAALRTMNSDEISFLVGLMKDGFTNSQIIKKCDKKYEHTSRLAYVVPDDLRYIRQQFNLHEGRFDDDDLESLRKRVERGWPEDGIYSYNPPNEKGDDFRLVIMIPSQRELCEKYSFRGVCLDDTHHSTKYPLKLTTMLVLNGQDRGIPVAFMLSSSCTSDDVAELFQCVKAEVPDFNPQYLMSDEANAFWNGFVKVFPNSQTKRLWCRWHVLRALESNADEKLTKETANTVKATLRELIREPDLIAFDRSMATMLDYLEDSGDAGQKYAEYFRKRYLPTVDIWATCHRPFAPFQTSMYSENWHSALKKDLLNRNTNIRVDALLQTLYDGFHWVLRRILKQSGRQLKKASARRAQNLKNCQIALEQADNYFFSRNSNGDFEVEKKNEKTVYTVKDSLGCQCFQDENCHCECGACAYRFSCSCLYQMSGISCKHVHMVIRYLKSFDQELPNENDDFEPFQNIVEPIVHPTFTIPELFQGEDDAAGKIYDEFVLEVDQLCQKMRNLKKKPENIDVMRKILEQVRGVSNLFPSAGPSLPIRRDVSRAPKTSRQVMNHSKFLKRKRAARRDPAKRSGTALQPKRDPNICNVCSLRDPQLPSDMDPEELDSRSTEWLRCSNELCKIPVHYMCSGDSCPSCGGKFETYFPSDGAESSTSSDSFDDIQL